MKKTALLIFLTFILIGCSNEEEKVMNELKSKVQDKYRIVVFDDKKAVFRTHMKLMS